MCGQQMKSTIADIPRHSKTPVPILCYHSIDTTGSLLSTSPRVFSNHMLHLKRHGYTTLTFGDLVDRLSAKTLMPPKLAVITFDDGYRNNREIALPILKRYGFTATFFVVTDAVGKRASWIERDFSTVLGWAREGGHTGRLSENHRKIFKSRNAYLASLDKTALRKELEKLVLVGHFPLMSFSELSILSSHGFEIGAHSHTHPFLAELTENDVYKEARRSKEMLQNRLRPPVTSFCYPSGNYSTNVAHIVATLGYSGACTTERSSVSPSNHNIYALPRLLMHDSYDAHKFRLCLSRWFPLYVFAQIIWKRVKQ
ncbi:MAG: polysaccharide deacetylase family protein [Chitinivibrionales bacterium]|nr:polysaccharide deacetylase family protein [Chitinivibrionales bacterium]MBD3358844.1 polysaccharide deacetylase family protein [Chitinivibrionales bacterium]